MTSTYCTTHNFFLSPPCFTISYLKSFTATLCKKKKKKTFLGYVSRNAFLETLYSKKGASNIKPNSWLDIKLVSQPFHPLTQKPQRFVHPFTSSSEKKKHPHNLSTPHNPSLKKTQQLLTSPPPPLSPTRSQNPSKPAPSAQSRTPRHTPPERGGPDGCARRRACCRRGGRGCSLLFFFFGGWFEWVGGSVCCGREAVGW